MSEEELKEAVLLAKENLSTAIEEARANGITVNLWIKGTGQTYTGPSIVDLDFLKNN
jgi:hypothetical protein